jgi:hypothetical protein
MIKNILEHMALSRSDRRQHLKLDQPCDERGLIYSYHLSGLLAYVLHTTIPKKGDNAIVCHGCNNARCSNPDHLYWGSYKDNHIDQVENGTWESPHARTKKKYGEENVSEIYSINGKKERPGGRKSKTEEHKQKISESIRNKLESGNYKPGRKSDPRKSTRADTSL